MPGPDREIPIATLPIRNTASDGGPEVLFIRGGPWFAIYFWCEAIGEARHG
jgi:hypothetical protein